MLLNMAARLARRGRKVGRQAQTIAVPMWTFSQMAPWTRFTALGRRLARVCLFEQLNGRERGEGYPLDWHSGSRVRAFTLDLGGGRRGGEEHQISALFIVNLLWK